MYVMVTGCMRPRSNADQGVGALVLEQLGDEGAWCAVEFPDLAAADACAVALHSAHACHLPQTDATIVLRIPHDLRLICQAAQPSVIGTEHKYGAGVHTEHHSHLQMCVEPHWQTFGSSTATATADLVGLAGWLRCHSKPQALPRPVALCLLRGAPAVLAAVERAGGVHALAAADIAAAICLGHCLMEAVDDGSCCEWVSSDLSSQLANTFAPLGPRMLSNAAAEMFEDALGSLKHACTAVLLTRALLATDHHGSHPNDVLSSRQQASGLLNNAVDDIHVQWQDGMPSPHVCFGILHTAPAACAELHTHWMAAGADCFRLQWAAGCSGICAVRQHHGHRISSATAPSAKQCYSAGCAADRSPSAGEAMCMASDNGN